MAAQTGRHGARDGTDQAIMIEQTDKPANRRGDMLAVALMAMMTLVVFWQALVKPDQMLREDAAHFYQPYYTYANAEVQAGRFPLWNPYTKMGVPFHASLQPSLLYPLRWPMFFMNYVSGFVSTMMAHYFMTAIAAYLLLRIAVGVGPLAGLIGALSVAFGGFSMGHMTHTTYFLSYPWFLGCILCLWLAVERKRWLWTVPAGGCVGLMGLVGSVHLFLLLGVLLGTYVLYHTIIAAVAAIRQWKDRKVFAWKPIVNPAAMTLAAMVLGGAISAAQMLPAYSLSKRSSRQEAQWEFITRASAHPVRNSLQLAVPFYYGNCRLGYYGEYMYHGAAHYTGIVVLMGAVVSLMWVRGDRKLWFWVVLAVVGFLVGAGKYLPTYRLLYDYAPMFSKLRNPTRIFWLTDLAIAALGAVGIDRVLSAGLKKEKRKPVRWMSVASGGVILVVLAGALMSLAYYAKHPEDLLAWLKTTTFNYAMNIRAAQSMPAAVMHDFDPATWLSVAAIVASVGVFVTLAWRGKAVGKIAGAILVAVVAADLWALSFGMIMYEDRWKILNETPPRAKWLQENLGLQRYAVIPGPPNVWPQDEQIVRARSVQFGLRNTGGKAEGIIDSQPRLQYVGLLSRYAPMVTLSGTKYIFVLKQFTDAQIRKIYPEPQFKKAFEDERFKVYENTRVLPMVYFVRQVTSVADSQDALQALLSGRVPMDRAATVLGPAPPETLASGATAARVVNTRTVPGRWEIDTDSDAAAQLVLLEGFDSGWRATIGGKETKIYQTNDQVMSVSVPAGKQTVVFEYAPAEFRQGIMLSIFGLLLAGALPLASWARRRRSPKAPAEDAAGDTASPKPTTGRAGRKRSR